MRKKYRGASDIYESFRSEIGRHEKAPSCSRNLATGFSNEEETATNDALIKLLKSVITKRSYENGEFISLIFVCPKHDGTFLFIPNLKNLHDANSLISVDHYHTRLLFSRK